MSDGFDPISRAGIDPIAPTSRLTRVRRDEGDGQGRREQQQDARPEPGEDEDDGLVHVDVRA